MPKGYPGSVSPHGTPARYGTGGCRCESCRAAWREKYYPGRRPWDEFNDERVARADATHGEQWSYRRGCRCDSCRAAANAGRAERRRTGTVLTHNAAGYSNGCRCDVCRAANAEKARRYYRAGR